MQKCKMKWLCLALLLTSVSCGQGNAKQDAEQVVEAEVVQTDAGQSETTVDNQPQYASGEVRVISADEFSALVTDIDNPKGFQYKGSMPCIVDFYADWCGPCHALNPVLADIAAKYKDKIMVYKVNVDKSAVIAEAFQIKSIPTLVFFSPHAQPTMAVGAPAREDLERAIQDLLLK